MPRINLAKDFKGFNYITSETFNLPAGADALFDNSGKIALSLMPSIASLGLDLSDYTSDNGVKLTNTKADGAVELIAASGKNLKLNYDGSLIYNGAAQNAANGLVVLDSNAKIAASMLPDLAITQVYTADASSAVVGTDSVLGLIKTALGANIPQRGDVVIITATGKEQADAFGGTYLFTADVASVAGITASDYVKTYVPTGSITTVNGRTPNASGAVTVGWTNIGDGSVTSFGVASGVVSVNGITLAAVGSSSDAASANTIYGAKAYADGLVAALDGSATIASVANDVVTIKAGIVEVDGVVSNNTSADIVLSKVAKTGAAVDVSIADAGNLITATNVEAALAEIAGEIDAMDADLDATGTAANGGVFVVSGVTQVDGKITGIDSVEVEQAGAAAAVLGTAQDTATANTVYGAKAAAAAASQAASVADGKAVGAQNTADGIKTAISGKVVELVEKTITLANGQVGGVAETGITSAIVEGVVTMVVPGRVICVYDSTGKQVYPDITYSKTNGSTTLVADYGTTTPDTTWDVTYSKAITIA